jgi:UDP-N-acetylmuramoylalanine--D-glutamate ligase
VELLNKRALVVGLGRSGIASALFLRAQGAHVTVSDAKPQQELGEEIPKLLDQGIAVETGGHGERTFRGQDLIVVSPGVPLDSPALLRARAMGELVMGEIELAAHFLPRQLIAITGSNGKTTTTTLTGDIVAAGGIRTLVGGNIGIPAISLAEKASKDAIIILEVSSFQLETIQTFRPKIAVVLNITPDHLDRHRTFNAYLNAKARIFENQNAEDFAVLNADDPVCAGLQSRTRAQVFWFSRKKHLEQGACARGGHLVFRSSAGERDLIPISEIPLKGAHNLENVLAATCAATLIGCEPQQIRQAVRDFRAVEHRLEYVATVAGVEYYNDSKATNVDATIKALESFPANIHLILGGKDKASDYTLLNELLRSRVKCVYTIGSAAPKIELQIKDAAEIVRAVTLENAVQQASEAAKPGDVVLLAPACASFDQFCNYEHRGKVFKETVRSLTGASHRDQ